MRTFSGGAINGFGNVSIIGLGAVALAIYLGLKPFRLWWHGLALLACAAFAIAILSIAARQGSADPLARATHPFSLRVVARATLNAQVFMLLVYGAARGLRWLFRRVKKSKVQ